MWRVLFWEENAKPEGYTFVQTLKVYEDQLGTSIELQRPGASEQQDLIEALHQEKEDMAQILLNKISSLETRVNVNKSEFREMVSRVTSFPFSKRIVDVETPSKYMAPKVKKYKGDSDMYEYVCHFEQKMQTVSIPTAKLEAMKCKTFTQGLAGPALLWFH